MDWTNPLADWLYLRIKPNRQRLMPVCWRIKPIHLALSFLNLSISLLFSCPKRQNSIIMIFINCLFFQDSHNKIVNYPFNTNIVSRAAPGFARISLAYHRRQGTNMISLTGADFGKTRTCFVVVNVGNLREHYCSL